MIIMCDIDGVLNDLVSKSLAIYNSHTGKDIHMSDITTYSFYECLPKEDADGIVSLFEEKSLWASLSPLQGSQRGLKQLIKQSHQIYLATATSPTNFEWKIDWLQHHFPFIPSDNVIRITDKNLLKCDVMIDDCLDNLIGNVCERVVLDYPWNRSTSKDYAYDIKRANNWNDIVNIINNIERKMKEWEKV